MRVKALLFDDRPERRIQGIHVPIAVAVHGRVQVRENLYGGVKEHASSELKTTLDALESKALGPLRDALEQARDALVAKVKAAKAPAKLVRDLRLPRQALIAMEVRAMLDRAWDAGQRDAKREIRAAHYDASVVSSFIPSLAVSWLRSYAFYITGLIADHVIGQAKGIILNGIKTGEASSVIAGKLLETFLPFIGDDTVLKDKRVLTPHRLETIVRTNTTAAYNHGRLTYFMDKDVLPFLKGVRYSAILDERTTPVCNHLHGKVFKPSSPDLEALLPPNHFNALAQGTAILTARGSIPIENVVAGDLVLTHRGRWRKVYATMRKQADECVRLQLSSGRELWATEEHPLLTVRGWKAVRDLQMGDQLFEFPQQTQGLEDGGMTTDPKNFPSLFHQPEIAYELTGYVGGAFVDVAVKFKHYPLIDEREVGNVPANAVLEDEARFAPRKEIGHFPLIAPWLFAPSFGVGLIPSQQNAVHCHGIVGGHSGAYFWAFDAIRPMIPACPLGDDLGQLPGDRGLLLLGPDADVMPLAPVRQAAAADSVHGFDLPQRAVVLPMFLGDQSFNDGFVGQAQSDSPKWVTPTIITLTDTQYDGWVYNLAVEEDESYHAESLIVHNCRSVVVPIVAGEKIEQSEFITPSEVGQARELADAKFLAEKDEAREYAQRDESPQED